MKNIFIYLSILLSVSTAEAQKGKVGSIIAQADASARKSLLITPAKPTPGSVITIQYNPEKTPLTGKKNIECVAYLMETGSPLALEISLTEEKGMFSGTFKTNDTTKAFLISFSHKEKDLVTDNNNELGYTGVMYDDSGKVVAGAYSALAIGIGNYSAVWNMKRNAELAEELNKKEFSSLSSRVKFYKEYFYYLGQTGNEADNQLLKKELQKFISNKNISEGDLVLVKFIYANVLKEKEKSDAVLALMKKKFPGGAWKVDEFFATPDLMKKEALFHEVVKAYGNSKEGNQHLTGMAQTLAEAYADSANFSKIDQYLGYIKDKSRLGMIYHYLALALTQGGINFKPDQLPRIIGYAKEGARLIQAEMNNLSNKPRYRTAKQYAVSQNRAYHMALNMYAVALYHNNEAEKAYPLQKDAVAVFEGNNVSMNEAFALTTEKVKGAAEAQKILEKFIIEGKANPAMKSQLKTLYLRNNTEEQYSLYIMELEAATYNRIRKEIATQIINKRAPDFNLKNLSGENVSLSALKGKTVVLDFWATWCTPCIASFPAMQIAIDKFKNNPDVVFLFIDTYETQAGREKLVADFMRKHKYTFNVLYDEETKAGNGTFNVAAKYEVTGIPAKIIIDRNNNIRFISSGYNGSNDKLVHEIIAMIELAKASSEPEAGHRKR